MDCAVRLDQVGDQNVHGRLRPGGKVSLDVGAADRLADRALDERDAALPAGAQLGVPVSVLP